MANNSLINLKNKNEKETNRRISLAWSQLWNLKYIWRGSHNNNLKNATHPITRSLNLDFNPEARK